MEEPSDGVELDLSLDPTTPLKEFVAEAHEIFEELKKTGFEDKDALQVISNVVLEFMLYRGAFGDSDEYDDEDDEDEDPDDDNYTTFPGFPEPD